MTAGEKEEEWSKERIQAEMRDLERSAILNLVSVFMLPVGCILIVKGLMSLVSFFTIAEAISLFAIHFLVGVIFVVEGFFRRKKYLQKRRRYNELKARL